jgi:hypothetical protein
MLIRTDSRSHDQLSYREPRRPLGRFSGHILNAQYEM